VDLDFELGRGRELSRYGIAAKRYTLYIERQNDIEIVEPKAHGLGYWARRMSRKEEA
jgi:hypothetical protein